MTDESQRLIRRSRRVAWVSAVVLTAAAVASIVYVATQHKSQGLMIYVGSSMRQPMEQCAAEYEKSTGVRVTPSFADSGEVLAQVRESGRGDLAVLHEPYLEQGIRQGWSKETFVVASMTPVIAVANGNPKGVKGLKDLTRGDLRVGLTDYRYATSGAIAREAMKRAGILESVLARQPYENKSSGQVSAQVIAGAIDAAIIWDAVAGNSPDKLDTIPIEPEYMPAEFTDSEGMTYHDGHVPVGMMLLSTSRDAESARKFAAFVLSERGQAIWRANGYSPPPASAPSGR